MYKARYSTYNSLDEVWETHPDAVTCIKSCTHDYRGKVYIFTELEDFGIVNCLNLIITRLVDCCID